MAELTDELLFQIYMIGWKEEMENVDSINKLIAAYNIGWNHSLLEDDSERLRNLTKQEIIAEIREKRV